MINIDSYIEADEEKGHHFHDNIFKHTSWMKMLEYFTEFCSVWFNFP